MATNLLLSKPFTRKLRKMLPQVVAHLQREVAAIQEKPSSGKKLRGTFRKMQSKRSVFMGVQYRVLYYIHPDGKSITILDADTREDVHTLLKKLKAA